MISQSDLRLQINQLKTIIKYLTKGKTMIFLRNFSMSNFFWGHTDKTLKSDEMMPERHPLLIDNILENVLSNLENSIHIPLVCKKFNQISSNNVVWEKWSKGVFDKRFPSIKEGFKHNKMIILKKIIYSEVDNENTGSKLFNLLDRLFFNKIEYIKHIEGNKDEVASHYEMQTITQLTFGTLIGRLDYPQKFRFQIYENELLFIPMDNTLFPIFLWEHLKMDKYFTSIRVVQDNFEIKNETYCYHSNLYGDPDISSYNANEFINSIQSYVPFFNISYFVSFDSFSLDSFFDVSESEDVSESKITNS